MESHIEVITVKVGIEDGKIFNPNHRLLPCDLDELGCESASLDPYPYTWKASANCILLDLKEENVHKLKNDNHYEVVSQNTSETKNLFEVKINPQHLCNKPTEFYPTTYDLLYVAIHYDGFDMKIIQKIINSVLTFNLIRLMLSSRNLETSTSAVLNPNESRPTSIHGGIWTMNYNKEQNLTKFSLRSLEHYRNQN